MAKRKQIFLYNEDFLKFGFTSVEVNGEVRPQCVLCLETLAHSFLKEAKLQRHLESKNEKYLGKDYEFFKSKERHAKRSRINRPSIWGGVAYPHKDPVQASFSVAWKIARAKAAHTTGERLPADKPASIEMARIMWGEAVANKLAMVPLSDNTIKRRIEELSVDILQQTIAAVKRSKNFSLQLDETTDIGSDAQLMIFVRYRTADDYVEQFLFCRPLTRYTTGEEIYKR